MAVRHEANIPNHDREAISEALEAALYCAAFQRMEESEMKTLYSEIRDSGELSQAPAGVRRRLNRRRGWAGIKRALPRAARAAAVFIAALSIGAGIALAASPQARQWAAGVLQSRVIEPDGFFGALHASVTDGAAVDGRLVMAEADQTLSVYAGSDAQPSVYEWRDGGSRTIEALAADGGDLYALYAEYAGEPTEAFDLNYMPSRYGIGRVILGEDGAFDVAELADALATAILDPEGRRLESWGIAGMTAADGKLYFAAHYAVASASEGFSFKPANVRLFCWNAAGDGLSELDLSGVPVDWVPELFGGAYLATYDDGAALARVYRIEGATLSQVCAVPYSGSARPGSFALREDDDALLYVLDGSAWMAPDMDPSKAVRVAVSVDAHGRGLLLDANTYAVLNGKAARLFDLSEPVGAVETMVVDGDSVDMAVNEAFMESHPGVAITGDPGRTMEDAYIDLMLAGRTSADVAALDDDGFRRARDAGLVAPLTDPELVSEWEKLPEGLRAFLSADGQPAAVPMDFYAYPDVFFPAETWESVRCGFDDYPDTWRDYVDWLCAFSRSEAAGEYLIGFDGDDETALDIPAQFEMDTLWSMARAFALCWQAMGEDVDFTREEFAGCVDALADVDWRALRYGDGNVEGEDRRAVRFGGVYDPLFSEDDWTAGFRTLRIRSDAPRVSRASGCFAFIPAAGARDENARAYLRTLVAVNHAMTEGRLDAAAGYDFATDPEMLAGEADMSCTADSIQRYRDQVGDVAFPAEPDREALQKERDIAADFVSGKIDRQLLCGALNALYR